MKRLCLETIITLLYQCRTRSADTIKSVCSGIFATYDLDITSYNKELSSHLKSGHDPVIQQLQIVEQIIWVILSKRDIEQRPSISMERISMYQHSSLIQTGMR